MIISMLGTQSGHGSVVEAFSEGTFEVLLHKLLNMLFDYFF